MLIDEYSQHSPYTISELEFVYWGRYATENKIFYYYVFAPRRSVKGIYMEQNALLSISGAVVPILKIATSMSDLFAPTINPLPAAVAATPFYVLNANGSIGAAAKHQPETETIETSALGAIQHRLLISDGSRQYVYACDGKEIKYDLDGEPQGYLYTLLPQVAGSSIFQTGDSKAVPIIEIALNDAGYIIIYSHSLLAF